MKNRYKICVPIIAMAGAAVAAAQTPPTSGSTESPPAGTAMRPMMSMSIGAQDFVSKAGMDGVTEVQLGQLAAKQAQSTDVKQFAQKMVTDHGKANAELTAIAKRKNLQVPASLDSEHQDLVQMLSAKSGTAFDAAYVKEMLGAHDKAVALFTRASKSNDVDIAAFAGKTLPTLQMHKEMAQKLAAKSGGQ